MKHLIIAALLISHAQTRAVDKCQNQCLRLYTHEDPKMALVALDLQVYCFTSCEQDSRDHDDLTRMKLTKKVRDSSTDRP